MTAVVVPLVSEAYGGAVIAEGPDLLDQAVIKLTCASGKTSMASRPCQNSARFRQPLVFYANREALTH
jgi:hypothetical protein